jgi:hypothetical protein
VSQRHGTDREAPEMPEQRSSPSEEAPDGDLTLAEAAQQYEVSLRTLRQRVSLGDLPAHKVSGARGKEWRVASSTLHHAGYRLRLVDLTDAGSPSPEVRRLTEALALERARSADLDQRLGYALLAVGRLRGRLREAGIDPDALFGADIQASHIWDGPRG